MSTLDFRRYKWRLDEDQAGRFKREVAGGELIEDVWNIMNHGEQNLFLGVLVSLSEPCTPDRILDSVRQAWKSLRWEVPTIAATTMHVGYTDRLPITFMIYDVATSCAEVDEWISATVKLQTGFDSLDELRYYLGQTPIPAQDLEPQTFLHILPFALNQFGILLHTSHVPFDGPGIKVLMTKLLTHLSHYLTDPEFPNLQAKVMKWGTEGSRLLPVKTEVLGGNDGGMENLNDINEWRSKFFEESTSGKGYEQTLEEVFSAIASGAPRVHPFKSFIQPPFDPHLTAPKTRRLGHTFSEAESAKIKSAGKPNDASLEKLTVNHLVHGALSLIPIIDNPPSENSNAVIFYFGLINGRKRLRKEYRGRLDYPGYCLGMSPIQIPVAHIQALPIHDHKASVLAVARMIQKEYQKQAALPSLVAIEPQLIEMLLSGGPLPPFSGPSYSADGPGNLYLDSKYPEDGAAVLEITDFFLSLNKCDPGPFFRATEWNGRILLSVDFNELAVDRTIVQDWMDTWVKTILSLTM